MTESTPVSAGAVLYSKDISRIGAFYAAVAGLAETRRDRDFIVLEFRGFQLVVVAVPERIASTIAIADPPRRREETPIKLIFVVASIDAARRIVADRGGAMNPPDREWQFGVWRVCDGHDPEGNVFQLREPIPHNEKGEPMSRTDDDLRYVAPVLRVADLDRSLACYRDRLGFTVGFVHEGRYAEVVRDGCRIHLKRTTPLDRDQQAFEAQEHVDACIAVRDAQALSSQFSANGAVFSTPLRVMPYGMKFYVRDPDGYILGFVQTSLA